MDLAARKTHKIGCHGLSSSRLAGENSIVWTSSHAKLTWLLSMAAGHNDIQQ